jgi:signal peptidase I
VQARSKARTENSQADLTTLDFLRLATYQFSQESELRVKMAGKSMSPAIEESDSILIKSVPTDQLSVGDVILYASLSDTAVIHRIVRIEKGAVVTRGDFCSIDDAPVALTRVLGKVVDVERDGNPVPVNHAKPSLWRRIRLRLGI